MVEITCDRCKGATKKKGSLMMSNSKFEVYTCTRCGAEKKICVGVVGK